MWLQSCAIVLLLHCAQCLRSKGPTNNVVFVPFGKEEPLIRRIVVIPVTATPQASRRFFSPIPGTTIQTTATTTPAITTPDITTPATTIPGITTLTITTSALTTPVIATPATSTPTITISASFPHTATDLPADNLPEISVPRSTSLLSGSSPVKSNLERPPMNSGTDEEKTAEVGAVDKPQVKVDVEEATEEDHIQPMLKMNLVARTMESNVLDISTDKQQIAFDNDSHLPITNATIDIEEIKEDTELEDNITKVVDALKTKLPDFPRNLLRSIARLHILKGKLTLKLLWFSFIEHYFARHLRYEVLSLCFM
jgi:hypothetical protein